jgi:uncharacterized protein YjeT (DUF2065 family)
MCLLYVLGGGFHFVAPKMYERVVPPQFPRPRLLVYLSGIAEIVLGIGVLFEPPRRQLGPLSLHGGRRACKRRQNRHKRPSRLRNAMALFQQEESKVEENVDEMADSVPMSVGDPVATLAGGSVLYAWYKFYMKGDKEGGLFVGLWAPTLLTAANYLQQKDIIQKFKKGITSF